jgi:hypothetical protein
MGDDRRQGNLVGTRMRTISLFFALAAASLCQVSFEAGGRKVWVQSREDLNFPMLTDFGENCYGLQFSRGRHSGAEWMHLMISHDGGQTWLDDRSRTEVNRHGSVFIRRGRATYGFSLFQKYGADLYGTFVRQIVSIDNGRSWAESFEPAIGCQTITTLWNAPVEYPDGTLIAVGYGKFPNSPSGAKRQVMAVERAPDGTVWRMKSDVFGAHPDTPEGGPNESCLALVPNGRLVCVGRTGYPNSPLLWAYSDDRAKTWSPPKKLPWSGVDPVLYTMGNGVLVLIAGARREEKRTGVMIAAGSVDGGETWSKPFVFYDGPGSAYHSAIKTGPDRLLVAYAESEFRRPELPQLTAPGSFNRLCAVTVRINRNGPGGD